MYTLQYATYKVLVSQYDSTEVLDVSVNNRMILTGSSPI